VVGAGTPEGGVTDAIVEYHRKRAAAGCGLIIVEHSFVHPRGRHSSTQLGVCSDTLIDGLSRLAAAVKAEGAVVALQISHAGSKGSSAVLAERPLAPSAIQHPGEENGEMPEALQAAQISEVVMAFGQAAGEPCRPDSTQLRFTARTASCFAIPFTPYKSSNG